MGIFRKFDKFVTAGLLPGGAKPLEFQSDLASGVKSGASSAWDIFSGERDYRRQQRDATAARDYTAEREDSAYQRSMADLEKAGINPMLAGQLGGAASSAPQVPQSRTAEGVHRIAGLAGGLLSGSVNAANTIAQTGMLKASTAKQVAEAAQITAHMPVGIAKDVALTGLAQAQTGAASAGTAESGLRQDQMKRDVPRQTAEGDFYRRYGRSAVLAERIKNPQQAALLVTDQAGRGPIQRTINSASATLAKSAQALDKRVKKPSSWAQPSSVYNPQRR